MNEAAREALRAAALKGTRQIYGCLREGNGRCAEGVLLDAGLSLQDLHESPVSACHLCGATETWTGVPTRWTIPIDREERLLIHLNNDHKLDFIGIAEKMPQEAV